nr:MAG TPA: hypothetical protein [Caudoviricetes sp.]
MDNKSPVRKTLTNNPSQLWSLTAKRTGCDNLRV